MALKAVCVIVGQLIGTILFTQENANTPLSISGTISNLTQGEHGFHVHEYGDIRNNCLAAGAHFNPFHKDHGAPNDEIRHVGDFGNIMANNENVATFSMTDRLAQLYGENTILGRAIVVHSGQDDLGKGGNEESKKTGNAGSRLGCCVIGIAKSD